MPTRFNPPPGWPPTPRGWMPPPGWQPDPSWPDPPQGWPLWVEDNTASRSASADSWWAIGGGGAVFLGSLLPFISSSSGFDSFTVHAGAKVTSAIFGLVLAGCGLGMKSLPSSRRSASQPKAVAFEIPLLGLSILGALGYIIFAAVGMAGIQEPTGLGFSAPVAYSPGIGVILAILGCGAAGFGAFRTIKHRDSR